MDEIHSIYLRLDGDKDAKEKRGELNGGTVGAIRGPAAAGVAKVVRLLLARTIFVISLHQTVILHRTGPIRCPERQSQRAFQCSDGRRRLL